MTERLITFACALGALALFLVLFVNPGGGVDARAQVPRPTTEELGGDGYHAAYTWLGASKLRTVSLRQRFDALAAGRDFAASGNVLVVTLPAKEVFRIQETRALQKWIQAGNTLVVLAAVSDSPAWAQTQGGVNVGDLKVLTGLDFTLTGASVPGGAEPITLQPNRAHAYFESVGPVTAAAARSKEAGVVRLPYDSFVLVLAHEHGSGNALLWSRILGRGRIIVSGVGSLFSDNALGNLGNGELLANIIGAKSGSPRRGDLR